MLRFTTRIASRAGHASAVASLVRMAAPTTWARTTGPRDCRPIRLDVVQERDERELVEQIALAQISLVLQVRDALERVTGGRRTMPLTL
jgi:hypothetical protein